MSSSIQRICILAAMVAGLSGAMSRADELSLSPVRPLMMDVVPMANPADAAHGPSTQTAAVQTKVPNWELPPVTVVGQPSLKSDQLVGSYEQPRWTVDRRFPGVRVYVIPEDTVEFEYWTRVDIGRKGTPEVQNLYELEFGLPYRFQFDLYAIQRIEDHGTFFDTQFELRWAFADWGKMLWNPTIYLEYAAREEETDKVEVKLLLGDSLGNGWHWGQNFLYEAEIGDEREWEYGWTGGLSKTVIDTKLDVGAEAQFSFFDVAGNRGSYTYEAFLGPSVQYRPTSRIHLNFAPLFGIGGESPVAKIFFNFGYEF